MFHFLSSRHKRCPKEAICMGSLSPAKVLAPKLPAGFGFVLETVLQKKKCESSIIDAEIDFHTRREPKDVNFKAWTHAILDHIT